MSFWQLDKAKASKVGQSNYITGNTQDVFKILSASWQTRQAKNNNPANLVMSLHIENKDKQTAHLDIYYGNTDGERWSGENLINAIMMCCNLEQLSSVQGTYLVYNHDQGKDVQVQGNIAPELAGKYVGMFLADNYYVNKNHELKRGGINLFNVYDWQSKQLAWQKVQNEMGSDEKLAEVAQAMLKASESSKKQAEKTLSDIGYMPAPTQATAPTANNDFTYKRNVPTQNARTVPMAHALTQPPSDNAVTQPPSDDDIPF